MLITFFQQFCCNLFIAPVRMSLYAFYYFFNGQLVKSEQGSQLAGRKMQVVLLIYTVSLEKNIDIFAEKLPVAFSKLHDNIMVSKVPNASEGLFP